MFGSMKEKLSSLAEKLRMLRQKEEELQAKLQRGLDFLQSPENQETFRFLKRQIGKILVHIRPLTFQLKGCFGSEDPARTGQILGVVYMLYPLYGDSIELEGDFEETVLEGETALTGRIRLGTLVVIGVRTVMNPQVRGWLAR